VKPGGRAGGRGGGPGERRGVRLGHGGVRAADSRAPRGGAGERPPATALRGRQRLHGSAQRAALGSGSAAGGGTSTGGRDSPLASAHFSRPLRMPVSVWNTGEVFPCITPVGARTTSPGEERRQGRRAARGQAATGEPQGAQRRVEAEAEAVAAAAAAAAWRCPPPDGRLLDRCGADASRPQLPHRRPGPGRCCSVLLSRHACADAAGFAKLGPHRRRPRRCTGGPCTRRRAGSPDPALAPPVARCLNRLAGLEERGHDQGCRGQGGAPGRAAGKPGPQRHPAFHHCWLRRSRHHLQWRPPGFRAAHLAPVTPARRRGSLRGSPPLSSHRF
jgi:hypothetical protein